MSKGKELVKNTFILFVGIFFTKIIQYFLLPVYTFYLTTEEYGTVDLCMTIISLLIPIISLQIDQGVFRYLISERNNKEKQKEYISTSFIYVLLSSGITFLLMLIINPFIHQECKYVVELNLFINFYFSYIMQVSRGLGNNREYTISNIITSITTVSFNILLLIGLGLKIDALLYGAAIGYIIGTIYVFIRLKIFSYISIESISKVAFRRMLNYSLPMIPNTLSWWIFSSSDRLIVSSFISLSSTGLIAITYKFSNIGLIIYNVFNMSLTESIALHIDDKDAAEYFNKVYSSVGQLFITFSSVLIAFMPVIFSLLINEKYKAAYGLIPIAIVATEFQVFAGMLGTIYVANKNTKKIANSSIVSAIVNIIIDLLLIKYIGIYAAIVSTLLSFLILFIYRIIDVNKRYIKIEMDYNIIISLLINVLVICPLFYIRNNAFQIINIVLSFICLIVFNKNNIKNVIKIFKRRTV